MRRNHSDKKRFTALVLLLPPFGRVQSKLDLHAYWLSSWRPVQQLAYIEETQRHTFEYASALELDRVVFRRGRMRSPTMRAPRASSPSSSADSILKKVRRRRLPPPS